MPRPTAMILLVAAMSLTGANVPLAKRLIAAFPADVLLLLRFALATLVLAIVARSEPGARLATLSLRQWAAVAVLGLVGSVGFTWALLAGVERTSATSAGIILAALPAVVAVIAFVRGARLAPGEIVMIGLAVAGVALLQTQTSMPSEAPASGRADSPVGNLLIGIAVLCEAAFVIAARDVSRHVGPLRLSLAVAAVSLAACLPAGLIGLARFQAGTIAPQLWALLAWYALTASVLCTALWYRGVAHVEPWAAGLATAAVPVAALAVSALFLGERIGLSHLAGAGLVVAAIGAGTLSRRRRSPL